MRKRFLLPGVESAVLQETASLPSRKRTSFISWNSNRTSSSVSSPLAWYFARILKASSSRPLAMSHRGDSGKNGSAAMM